jgi:hypothetical protein
MDGEIDAGWTGRIIRGRAGADRTDRAPSAPVAIWRPLCLTPTRH